MCDLSNYACCLHSELGSSKLTFHYLIFLYSFVLRLMIFMPEEQWPPVPQIQEHVVLLIVQLKVVSTCLEKLLCAPPDLSEASLMLPLKQFQYRMNINETKLI